MIKISNDYMFHRTNEGVVLLPASYLAFILGLQPYELKEHYFYCVMDECFSKGEFHLEEISNGEIELYFPVFSVQAIIESLKHECFEIDEFQSKTVIDKMLETQRIVSDCFDFKNGGLDYKDPIRTIGNPHLKELKYSISRLKDD